MQVTRSKWFVPMLSLALGVVVFAVQWVGGDPGSGLVSLAIMAGFGVLVLAGGRSETIRGLRGDGRDERFRKIDIHATAVAGTVVLVATIIGALVRLGQGEGPGPYGWLAAVGAGAYLAAVLVFRARG